MDTRTSPKSEAYWGRRAVGCLLQKFNCPVATMQTCQDMINRKEDAVLTSLGSFFGGGVFRGSTCGVVSGGALGIALMHDEKLQRNGAETQASVISLAADYAKWFEDTYGTTLCCERIDVDFWTLGGLINYMLPGHKMVRCMRHINGTMKYLYRTQTSNPPLIKIEDNIHPKHIHCAQDVLEGINSNTGVSDPVLDRISIVLDGGVALQGGVCGALAGAILALNLIIGVNFRDVSIPGSYYAFFKGLTFLRSEKPAEISNPYNVGKKVALNFEKVAGSINCSEITGTEFNTLDEFQSYINTSEKCNELIEFSINEATSAIQQHRS